jgi:hypothetical protein
MSDVCRACTSAATHSPCCSSHRGNLCCHHYRRFHFVEVGNCCAEDAKARPEAAK